MAFEDVPEMSKYLLRLNSELEQMTKHVGALKEQVDSRKYSLNDGVDLLTLKNQLLTSYLMGLTKVALLKTQGVRTEVLGKNEVVNQLVEDRVVLEKLRPLEAKFSYQLDKLLRTAATGRTGSAHPLQFRPAPHQLVSKLSSSKLDNTEQEYSDMDEEEGEGQGEESGRDVYVPPHVLAVPYNDDKEEASAVKSRSTVEQRRLLSELRNEWSDLPAELQTLEEGEGHSSKLADREVSRARESYEEEYLVRLPKHVKTVHAGRKVQHVHHKLTDFSMLRSLTTQHKGSSGTRRKKLKRKRTH